MGSELDVDGAGAGGCCSGSGALAGWVGSEMSDEKVVSLKVVPSEPEAVNADAIEVLEAALADVRAGKAGAVGVVIAYREGSVSTAWSRGGFAHLLTSGAATLLHRLASL